ncbi:MAG: hypothetical protein ACD_17C00081G0002 [uncultured bacterium]|nr:MAG: hypothetical protein ACD_17C00081G0002 [uncultured bacterium]
MVFCLDSYVVGRIDKESFRFFSIMQFDSSLSNQLQEMIDEFMTALREIPAIRSLIFFKG